MSQHKIDDLRIELERLDALYASTQRGEQNFTGNEFSYAHPALSDAMYRLLNVAKAAQGVADDGGLRHAVADDEPKVPTLVTARFHPDSEKPPSSGPPLFEHLTILPGGMQPAPARKHI